MSRYDVSATKSSDRFTPWALALGVFGAGGTEFVPVGLLPQVTANFAVSIPVAGSVVSSYAAGA